MLCIDLTPLAEGGHHIALETDARALDLDPEQFAEIHVDVTLHLFNDRALIVLHVEAIATLECDRTLVLFAHPIEGTHRIFFAPPSFVRDHDDEAEYEEVRVLHHTDRSIDLTDSVRDTVLLAVPARKIAPGAEDLDIPVVFGAPREDEAVDPRWQALQSLRTGKNAD